MVRIFRDPAAWNVFIIPPCVFFVGGKVGTLDVQPRAVRSMARDLEIRDQREILGQVGPHHMLNP